MAAPNCFKGRCIKGRGLARVVASIVLMAVFEVSVFETAAQPDSKAPPDSEAPPKSAAMELTTPVRLELRRLQESWHDWTAAYFQDNEEKARHSLVQLQTVAENLGLEKLPDQSVASAAFAVRSAREGNFERARWAVDCARELDPDRPEAEFASAEVERLAGGYLTFVTDNLAGYLKLIDLPLEGHIWRQNLGLGFLYVLLLAAGLHLVLIMAFRGSDLFHDLGRLVSPPLPRAGADAVALAALIWPLILPSGLLWLALYWSVLLWGYASWSQRGVLMLTGLAIGLSPAAIALHQQQAQGAILLPTRALENLGERRLYGALFLDLEVMKSLLPESPVVTEVIADLHRDMQQWEHARLVYQQISEANPDSPEVASAFNNIGVFYFRRGDFGVAVNFFTDAVRADSSFTEAYYNLSQAYYKDIKFAEGHEAMAEAKKLDPVRVARWEDLEIGLKGGVVATNGGLLKARGIRRALEVGVSESSLSQLMAPVLKALGLILAAGLLGAGLHVARLRKGYPSSKFTGRSRLAGNRWLRALVPGWASTRYGQGVAAFLAVFFFSILLVVPLLPGNTYRASLGADVGPNLATMTCFVALALFFLLRLGVAWREGEL